MTQPPILLVEYNDDDADLTAMAFRDAQVANPIVRVRDGVEALAHLHGGDGKAPATPPWWSCSTSSCRS
jgi:hypothetical protein